MISGVVVVSMLLLLVAFRSVMIAATAAVMNLLSVAAAYGVLAYFLEGGWAGNLIGIDAPAPLAGYVPVIMFALLFGLSMDYEVFLISRMSETWVRTQDNGRAILTGLAGTGRVITAAATIMIAVFAAMIAIDDVTIKSFGIGMVAAILVDATIVRMLLVPAVMRLLGRSNWWLPRPLERWMPHLHVEGRSDAYLSARTAETPAPAPVGRTASLHDQRSNAVPENSVDRQRLCDGRGGHLHLQHPAPESIPVESCRWHRQRDSH